MAACCRHYLARLYNVMGMSEKAKAEHLECIQMILSIAPVEQSTPQTVHTQETVLRQAVSGARKGRLFKHAWYQESARYILMSQQQRVADEEKESFARRQKRLEKPLSDLNAANKSQLALLQYLQQKYPVPDLSAITTASDLANLPKKEFLKVVAAYHPDKRTTMKELPATKGWTSEDWHALYTEIGKRLNHWYEVGYK